MRFFLRAGRSVFFVLAIALSIAASAQAAERNVPGDYQSIQLAIDAAQPGDTVVVGVGTYREPIVMRSEIILKGEETARTLLTGNGEKPVIRVDGATGVRISNFTFVDLSSGIQVTGNAEVNVAANVFDCGGGDGIRIFDNAIADISNNTFYDCGTAFWRAHDGVKVRSNLFYDNVTAISPAGLNANIRYNGFLSNGEDGPTGVQALLEEPMRFISVAKRDFHLRYSSNVIDKGDENDTDVIDGTRADMGAYGGPYADPTPFPVSGLSVQSEGSDSVTLSWEGNAAYLIAGYRLYYGNDAKLQGSEAAEGPSPIDVGDVTQYRLTGLATAAPVMLDAPRPTGLAPSHQSLEIGWLPVVGASGYKVHYGMEKVTEKAIDVGNRTSYRITGLENGVLYRVAVSAYSQATYHFGVTAYDKTAERHESAIPGESRVEARIGEVVDGPLSGELSAFPEALQPYPDLPDEGCFVATAAYGYYDASQVQLLREYRDRYLMKTASGKWFVQWYYTHAPAAARWLESHPEFKPLVRAALFPVITAAGLVLERGHFYLVSVMMLCGILVTMAALIFRGSGRFVPGEE